MASKLKILTANAHRISSKDSINEFLDLLKDINPTVAYIQEIGVKMAVQVLGAYYQILINVDESTMGRECIGIATLIKKGIQIKDVILGDEGRTIGIKTRDVQFWNIYPKSGTGNKKWREQYFREDLPDMMTAWKDHTRWINQGGDFNCTHRLIDSLNNQNQHLQKGLQKHMKVWWLEDDYVRLNGDQVCYSRITNQSRTRIDMILSNMNQVKNFEYWETGLPAYDHKFGIAEYETEIEVIKENIPRERKYNSWAFPRELEGDEDYLKEAKDICEVIFSEIEKEKEEDKDIDYTEKWVYVKQELMEAAKRRTRELRRLENGRKDMLRGFLELSIKKIEAGKDDWENFKKIREELRNIMKKKTARIIEKNKSVQIVDHIYDIQKVQKQKKYESNSQMKKLNIGGNTYEGTMEILRGMEAKIKSEVEDYEMDDLTGASEEEMEFLMEMEEAQFTEAEKKEMVGLVTEDECELIFEEQVNLDSSPGPDGCTYRMFYYLFRKIEHFRMIYVKMIDWTRKKQSLGCLQNDGAMKVINKKRFSENYDGKRKLMVINKDINFTGKVWSNRFRNIALPKVLPKCQYNCQEDLNIVDENRHIQEVVRFFRGDIDGEEKNGTLVAIDFKDAFRSVFLRWFRLVLERLNIPREFRKWFWALYKDLAITIVINGAKSGKIWVKRGMMEGHPPSMPCFVTAMIPLLIVLKRKLQGVKIHNGVTRKIFAFADDLKLVLREPQEIHMTFEVIKKFQTISGLEMHTDPCRDKCQALTFGNHRVYNNWPNWITNKEVVNILGILYGNRREVSLEQLNTDSVRNKVFQKLFASEGIRGTVLQKVRFANTYLLSKIWYVSQIFILEKSILIDIDRRICNFIFAGVNERPVRAICYRPKEMAGLNLTCVLNKSRTFMVKNMFIEIEENDELGNADMEVYGNKPDKEKILRKGIHTKSIKGIYQYFLQEKIGTFENPIESRAEKKNPEIDWKNAWKNWTLSRGVTAELKYFGWCLIQDMVHVPSRNHRRGANKFCQNLIYDQELDEMDVCGHFGDLKHTLAECQVSRDKFSELKAILEIFLQKTITMDQIFFLSFRHFDKRKRKMAIWIIINSLFYIFKHKESSGADMLRVLKQDLRFHLMRERGFVPKIYISGIMEILENRDV